VDMLRGAGVYGVYGNTEVYIISPEVMPNDELHRNSWHTIQPAAYWVRSRLSEDQLTWLKELPFELRFSPTGVQADDLMVVHANPKDVELMIYPQPLEQRELWGDVRQPDDDPELEAVLGDVIASAVAFGHFHKTFQRCWRGINLIDVACCSMPAIDKDPRARYSVITWDGIGWNPEHHYVEYDHTLEVEALISSDLPYKESYLKYFNDISL